MKVGLLTLPFSSDDIETVVEFAAEAGFDCLEIRAEEASRTLNPTQRRTCP